MAKEPQELILEILSEEKEASSTSPEKAKSLGLSPAEKDFQNPINFEIENNGIGKGSPIAERARLNNSPMLSGVYTGKLVDGEKSTGPLVDYPGNTSFGGILARSTVSIREADKGKEVVLMFENGDPKKPIIMGLISPSEKILSTTQPECPMPSTKSPTVEVDGERVVLTGKKEIVLQCGKASITLTKTGKILIRGAYVSSRSSGPNLIKGGSVQLN